jgi:hypothetical protein
LTTYPKLCPFILFNLIYSKPLWVATSQKRDLKKKKKQVRLTISARRMPPRQQDKLMQRKLPVGAIA